MGLVKETDNITLDIYWKGWTNPTQRNDYISKTRSIANKIDVSASVNSRKDGITFISIELPHKELENYYNLDDDEYRLDYTKLYQLVKELRADDDVTSVQMKINELEKGGTAYVIDHNIYDYDVLKIDNEGLPLVICLYPLKEK